MNPIDLEYLSEHEHVKPEEAQAVHSLHCRHHGITDPDQIIADWNQRDPDAPWGSGKVGRMGEWATELTLKFMEAKVSKAMQKGVEDE